MLIDFLTMPSGFQALAGLHKKMVGNTRYLNAFDVIFVDVPQTLTPLSRAESQPSKRRPVILLEDVSYEQDTNGICTSDIKVTAVLGTTKEFLVHDRPHVSCRLKPRNIETFIHADGLRSIHLKDQRIDYCDHLPDQIIADMYAAIDSVLRPESLFKSVFNRHAEKYKRGMVWDIQTIDKKGPALILLTRGRLKHVKPDPNNFNDYTQAPYLVAFLNVDEYRGLRNLNYDDMDFIAVHSSAFRSQVDDFSKGVAPNILLNQFRKHLGFPQLEANAFVPDISRFFTFFPMFGFGR